MNKILAMLALGVILATPTFGATPCPVQAKKNKNMPIPLCFARQRVKEILAEYNSDPSTVNNGLPPLRKAELSFKTVTTKKLGFTVSVLVFTVGGTHQNDATREILDSWDVPQAPPNVGFTSDSSYIAWLSRKQKAEKIKDPSLAKDLRAFIQQVAEQEKPGEPGGDNEQHTVVLTQTFGVQWDFNVGAKIPIQLVPLGPTFDRNRADTQSIKLTFSKKPTKE
jgi:hypothetical protein